VSVETREPQANGRGGGARRWKTEWKEGAHRGGAGDPAYMIKPVKSTGELIPGKPGAQG